VVPTSPDLNPVDYAVWGGGFKDGLSTSKIHDKQPAEAGDCH